MISLITLGLLDCLNPATIATLIILIPLVKDIRHSAIFIWGTFATYFLVGLSFYYGIDKFIKGFIIEVMTKYSDELAVAGIIIALLLLGIGVKFTVKIINIIRKKEDVEDVNIIKIGNVNPKAIIGLSIISTLGDSPTAIPYIAFISNLLGKQLSLSNVVLLLAVYCLIYILPMLILYLSYKKLKDRFEIIEAKTKNLINKLSVYSIPVMAYAGGIWILIKAISI
jgi:cytochrome c biogenesis protein CcdA